MVNNEGSKKAALNQIVDGVEEGFAIYLWMKLDPESGLGLIYDVPIKAGGVITIPESIDVLPTTPAPLINSIPYRCNYVLFCKSAPTLNIAIVISQALVVPEALALNQASVGTEATLNVTLVLSKSAKFSVLGAQTRLAEDRSIAATGKAYDGDQATKRLEEGFVKLPKRLKDTLGDILPKCDDNKKLQAIGFIHSGLQSYVIRADRPTK
ncbi:hypothetical protein BDF21DRAFT_451587 [Thamnidium elegans]|nr:hypothetical protein BDF21DRAFT_451587 [Thamnidium elegans]